MRRSCPSNCKKITYTAIEHATEGYKANKNISFVRFLSFFKMFVNRLDCGERSRTKIENDDNTDYLLNGITRTPPICLNIIGIEFHNVSMNQVHIMVFYMLLVGGF